MIIKFSDMPSVYVYKSEGGKNKKYAEFIVGYCKAVGLMPNNKLCVRCSPHLALCLAAACEKHGGGLNVVTTSLPIPRRRSITNRWRRPPWRNWALRLTILWIS